MIYIAGPTFGARPIFCAWIQFEAGETDSRQ